MRSIPFYAVVLAVALMISLQGCTLFRWGSSSNSAVVAPEPKASETFKSAEELLEKGKYDQARQAYTKIKEQDPEKFYEPLVQIRLGDTYYEEARYAEAEVEYRHFLEMHPQNKAASYAKYQIAMCNFKQIDLPDRDQAFALTSVRLFNELLRDYPNNPYEDEAKEKLKVARGKVAQSEYVVGWYYYRTAHYKAAANRFKGILENYPGCKVEPETMYYLADSYIRTGDYDDAKNTLAVLYKEYPAHKLTAKAQSKLAEKIPAK